MYHSANFMTKYVFIPFQTDGTIKKQMGNIILQKGNLFERNKNSVILTTSVMLIKAFTISPNSTFKYLSVDTIFKSLWFL
jgi:hypothetical protein